MIVKTQKGKNDRYRYVIAGLILVVPLCTLLPYLAVSVLMDDIMLSLDIDYSLAGMTMTIMLVISGICMYFGSFIQKCLGLRQTVILAIMLLSAGSVICYAAGSFTVLFAGRMVLGTGFGLNGVSLSPFMGTWFSGKQRTFMISANLIANSLAAVASYSLANPLKNLLGSWNRVFLAYSLFIIAIAAVWIIFSKSNEKPQAHAEQEGDRNAMAQGNPLICAMKIRQYWVIMVMGIFMHAAMTALTAYLPSYLVANKGFSVELAATVSSANSIANILGALIGGAVVAKTGRKKLNIHVGLLLYMLGGLGITLVDSRLLIYISAALVGFSFMFIIPSQSTISMETIHPFNPSIFAAALALSSGTVNISSITVAPLFTSLSNTVGMTWTLRLFFLFPCVSLVFSFLLRETGSRKLLD